MARLQWGVALSAVFLALLLINELLSLQGTFKSSVFGLAHTLHAAYEDHLTGEHGTESEDLYLLGVGKADITGYVLLHNLKALLVSPVLLHTTEL